MTRAEGGSAELMLRPASSPQVLLADLIPLLGGQALDPRAADVRVRGISAASSLVQTGDLFAALPGRNGHGVRYLDQAVSAGAVAVLTDRQGAVVASTHGLPVVTVEDPRAALGPVSARIYGDPSRSLQVVGVTGTSGKTTTTSLVRAGLSAAAIPNAMVGTLGTFIGEQAVKSPFTTPEAPQLQAMLAVMVERGVKAVAMEVSSHALSLGRVDGIRFHAGAFTNLSQDHLDFHADMEDYFAAKAKLFDGRCTRELVVIDQDWGQRLVGPSTVTVSTRAEVPATWAADRTEVGVDGSTTFTVVGPGVRIRTGCRIPGVYNVANALLAFALLAELDVDAAQVAPALARAQVPGRMQRIELGQPFRVVIDYSHKPAGVAAALSALRPGAESRLSIVLGCGGDRDRGKRPVMGRVAASGADLLIVTDDNPRSEDPAAIRAQMLLGARSLPPGQSGEVREVGDRREAITEALEQARPGDTVLIAGKGHETGQLVGEVMLPFDDVSVATEVLMSAGYRGQAE